MTNNTPHTPTDNGELQEQLIDIVFADGASNPEMIVDKFLLPLIHQYGNTRAVEAVRKFADDIYPNVASAYVFNENVATASLLKDVELVLTQPLKENK